VQERPDEFLDRKTIEAEGLDAATTRTSSPA